MEQLTTETLTQHTGHIDTITSTCFSKDKRYLISGSKDKTIKIWDLIDPLYSEVQTLTEHTDYVRALCISADLDGKYLISGSTDKTIKVWSIDKIPEVKLVKNLNGHKFGITSICSFMLPQQDINLYIASGSEDITVRIWSLDTFSEVLKLQVYSGQVNSVCTTQDLQFLISVDECSIKIWSQLKEKLLKQTELQKISNNNSNTIINEEAKTEKQRNVETLKQSYISMIESGNCCCTNGIYLATAYTNIKIWQIINFQEEVENMSTSKDQQSVDNQKEWKLVASLNGHKEQINQILFSTDGRFLVSCGWDNMIKVWNMEVTNKKYKQFEIVQTLAGHSVFTLSFDTLKSGEQVIISGGYDNAIIIWHFKENKKSGEVIISQKFRIINTPSLQLDNISFENITQIEEANRRLLQQQSRNIDPYFSIKQIKEELEQIEKDEKQQKSIIERIIVEQKNYYSQSIKKQYSYEAQKIISECIIIINKLIIKYVIEWKSHYTNQLKQKKLKFEEIMITINILNIADSSKQYSDDDKKIINDMKDFLNSLYVCRIEQLENDLKSDDNLDLNIIIEYNEQLENELRNESTNEELKKRLVDVELLVEKLFLTQLTNLESNLKSNQDKNKLDLDNIQNQRKFLVEELNQDTYKEVLKKRLNEAVAFVNKLYLIQLGKLVSQLTSEQNEDNLNLDHIVNSLQDELEENKSIGKELYTRITETLLQLNGLQINQQLNRICKKKND